MHHLLSDAPRAGEAIHAGLVGAAVAPEWGAAGALALVAPVLAFLLARAAAPPAPTDPGAEQRRVASLEGAGAPGLRLVALVCGAIAALFAAVSAEAVGVVPLSALAGLLVGTALFGAFAWHCWGLARAAAQGPARRDR